jgi:hypothetical protein
MSGHPETVELTSPEQAEQLTALINERSVQVRATAAAARLPLEQAADDRIVGRCTYAAGAHLSLAPGAEFDLVFRQEQLQVYEFPAANEHEPVAELDYANMFELELGGPGAIKSGGGFVGGGFGLEGAVEGMAIASALNALTTRHKIVTVIRVADSAHEGFFVSPSITPEDLRRNLSPVYVALKRHASVTDRAASAVAGDLVSKIERLAALHSAGSLTDEEFASAKRGLLNQ